MSIREKDKLDLELMSYTDIAYEIIKEDLYIYQCNYFGFDDITLDEIYEELRNETKLDLQHLQQIKDLF